MHPHPHPCPSPIPVEMVNGGPGWADFWLALIPALIGAAVVVGVFYRTGLRDRRQAKLRRHGASIADVIRSVRSFTVFSASSEEHKQQFFNAQADFTHALAAFVAIEVADNGVVAEWVLGELDRYVSEVVVPLMKAPPGETFEGMSKSMRPDRAAGEIAGTLLRWARDGYPEKFDSRLAVSITDLDPKAS